MNFSFSKIITSLDPKYKPEKLLLKFFDYDVWYDESNDKALESHEGKFVHKSSMSPDGDKKQIVDSSSMPPLEGDEVKEGLTINLLTRLPLIAQIKAGNNSYKPPYGKKKYKNKRVWN